MENLKFNQNNRIENIDLTQLEKGGIKKSDLAANWQSIFANYDKDSNGLLDKEEITGLVVEMKRIAQGEGQSSEDANTMDETEAKTFLAQNGIDDSENHNVLEFAKSLVSASSKIKSFTEEGEGENKKITTVYEDGTEETLNANGTKIIKSKEAQGQNITTTFSKDGKNALIEYEDGQVITRIFNAEDEGYTDTTEKDGITIVNEYNAQGKKLNQTKAMADGSTFTLDYDGQGNTKVIVQNGESIATLAKKFDCSIKDIVEANKRNVYWTNETPYFLTGQEVKIPRELEADMPVLQNRQTSAEAKSRYTQDEQVRTAKRLEGREIKEITIDKSYSNWTQFAKEQLKAELKREPTAKEISDRANELVQLNPNISAPKKGSKINVLMTANEIKTKEQTNRQKAEEDKKQNSQNAYAAKVIANELYNACDDEWGAVGDKRFESTLKKINKDNVEMVLTQYRNLPQAKGETLLDTICSEVSSTEESRKKALNHIMNCMVAKAKESGVSADDIFKAQNDFKTSMNTQFNQIGRIETKDMEKALDFLHGAMLAKTTKGVEDIEQTTASASFLGEVSSEFKGADKMYQDARKEEGWTAKTGDTVLGWFGCTTKADMDKKLGAYKGDIQKLQNAKTEAEFKKAYYEVFGIEFDKSKVAAYEAAQGNYQKAEMLSKVQKNIDGLLSSADGKNYTQLSQEIKQKFEYDDATLEQILNSYIKNDNSTNPTDNDKKNMLVRFLQQTKASTEQEYQALTKGKTLEQLGEDLDLIRKSAFGTKDIVKDVIKYNENQVITEMATSAVFEIAGTIALQFVPGLGQIAAARLAVSAAKWGATGVKVIKMANTARKGFTAIQKFQTLNKLTRAGTAMLNAGAATMTVGLSDGKDLDAVAKKAAMNMAFAGIGAGSNAIAPQIMKSFGVSKQVATDIAESLLNAAGSAGVVKIAGGEYTATNGFVDFAAAFIMSRIAGRYVGKNDTPNTNQDVANLTHQRPSGNKPQYVIPEGESVLDKAVRNGNNPAEVAPPRSVKKLNNEKFAQIQDEVEKSLQNAKSLDDLKKLEQQIDALQDRSQRRILEAKLNAKKAQLEGSSPIVKKEVATKQKNKAELEADAKLKAEADAKLKAEADARLQAEADARLQAEMEANVKAKNKIEAETPMQRRPELDVYKIDHQKLYGQTEEAIFAFNLQKQGYSSDKYWSYFHAGENKHCAWKMHIYSVDVKDYQKMADIILPYLKEHNIVHKCLGTVHPIAEQAATIQRGKAFTIYPRSQAEFEQVAKDLDYIVKNNGLKLPNTNISGDKALGSTGRIHYRYEFKSKSQANDILDVSSQDGYNNYAKNYYDENRNGNNYLAKDMTPADDPFLNFDPSNPNSKPIQNIQKKPTPPVIVTQEQIPVNTKLVKNQKYEIDINSKLEIYLASSKIELQSPMVQNKLKALKDGESLTIGRGPQNQISIDADEVSRNHLRITRQGNKFIVEDLGSTNGTIFKKAGNYQKSKINDIDENELVRVAGNNGKSIDADYIKTSGEARVYLNDAIESGEYTQSLESYIETINKMHVISATGKSGNNSWYNKVGQGQMDINPGMIRDQGRPRNWRIESAIETETIAKKYGDPYRVNKNSYVELPGIPKSALPMDAVGGYHYYPDGTSIKPYYYKEMHRTAKETLNLIDNGASEKQILEKIAEHYQYAANARPYGQINNSLFMNEINTLLKRAGLKAIPHGNLDIASMHLQPNTFKKYFIDEYYKTALN